MKMDEPIKVVTVGAEELRTLLREVVWEVAEQLLEERIRES